MSEILWERSEDIRILTLHRPEKLNALTPGGLNAFRERLDEYRDDRNARVLIVTSTGRAFSTGLYLARAAERLGTRPILSTILAREDVLLRALAAFTGTEGSEILLPPFRLVR